MLNTANIVAATTVAIVGVGDGGGVVAVIAAVVYHVSSMSNWILCNHVDDFQINFIYYMIAYFFYFFSPNLCSVVPEPY